MTNTGFDLFDRTVQKSLTWLDDLAEIMGRDNRDYAYQALRAVLHTLRDRLTVQEAAHLSAQLPLLIRGTFYEGYHPASMPVKIRDRDELIQYVADNLGEVVSDVPPTEAIRDVFQLLDRRISAGQMEDVRQMMPEDIQDLWPEAEPG